MAPSPGAAAAAQGTQQVPFHNYEGSLTTVVVIAGESSTTAPRCRRPLPVPAVDTEGNPGTTQYMGSIAEMPNGDITDSWTQVDQYTDEAIVPLAAGTALDTPYATAYYGGSTIYLRQYQESTTSAGPQVTGLYGVNDTTGTTEVRIDKNPLDTTTAPSGPLQYLIVTFDEDMYDYPDVATQLAQEGFTTPMPRSPPWIRPRPGGPIA